MAFARMALIDAVFLLMGLFWLSSHLAQGKSELTLPLPEVQTGQRTADSNQPRLTVNVLGDGSLFVGHRAVDSDELARLLADRRAAQGGALRVRIRADRAVPYGQVESVLLACARAGIQNITYAVKPPAGPMTSDK